MDDSSYLIVGLGNPGKEYANTRHNMGFMIVEQLSKDSGLSFKKSREFLSLYAKGNIEGKKVILLLPQTFMNQSGVAVKAAAETFKIELKNLLVIVDDVAIPFGDFRLKESGSSGGHNGLRSIENALGTMHYPRLRVGIGEKSNGELADYVLSEFFCSERERIPKIMKEGVEIIYSFLRDGIEKTMNKANIHRNVNEKDVKASVEK